MIWSCDACLLKRHAGEGKASYFVELGQMWEEGE